MRIGLRFRRGIGEQWSAEVAKTQGGDDAVFVTDEGAAEVQPLIEATARSMDEKDRRSISGLGELDRSLFGIDDLPAGGDSLSGSVDVFAVRGVRQRGRAGCEDARKKSEAR